MKAMRLILEENSSTESRRAAARVRSLQDSGPVAIAAREKEVPMGKKPGITEAQPTPAKTQRASKKDKGKAVSTEEVPPRQDEVPSEGIKMRVPRERAAEVLIVSSDTEEDSVALEEVAAMFVEDMAATESEE